MKAEFTHRSLFLGVISIVLLTQFVESTPTASGLILYRLNAGGQRISSVDGGPDWESDSGFHSAGTQTAVWTVQGLDESVPNTTPREVFETERWDPVEGLEMQYNLPVPEGTRVEVRLYMMNGWDGAALPRGRLFHIRINGTRVIRDLDLSARYGHRIGGMELFVAESDGSIDIKFEHSNMSAPLINAIEIIEDENGSQTSPWCYFIRALCGSAQ